MRTWLDENPKSKQFSDMAKRRAKEKGIALSEALLEVARENPGLAEAARWEVMGSRPPEDSIADRTDALLAKMARERAAEKGISYSLALSEVAREFPEIARAAREAVLGCKVE